MLSTPIAPSRLHSCLKHGLSISRGGWWNIGRLRPGLTLPKNILTPGCDGGSLHKKYVHLRKTFCSLNQQKGMTTPQSNLQSSMFLYVIVLFLYSFGSHLLQVNTLGDERTRRSYSRPGSLADVTVDARVATQTLQATAGFAMLDLANDLIEQDLRRSNKISADPSRRQGERVRGAARKTGAEARTAKFEAGTWAKKTQEPGQARNARTTKRETAADVAQGAVNWALMGKPNTNQPQMQEGAQPRRFCQDLARSSVRHGDEVDRAMKRGPFPEPELREHLDEHLAQSEKHARVKLVHHPKRKSRIVPTSCRWSGWQICHAVHSFELQ